MIPTCSRTHYGRNDCLAVLAITEARLPGSELVTKHVRGEIFGVGGALLQHASSEGQRRYWLEDIIVGLRCVTS